MVSYYSDIGELNTLIDFFIWYYGESRSYNSADTRFELVIEPFIKKMSSNQFEQIIKLTNTNRQIWDRGLAYTANNKIMRCAKNILPSDFDYSKFSHFRFDDKILNPTDGETDAESDSLSSCIFFNYGVNLQLGVRIEFII